MGTDDFWLGDIRKSERFPIYPPYLYFPISTQNVKFLCHFIDPMLKHLNSSFGLPMHTLCTIVLKCS